jgi:hypothetical protein
MPEEEEEGEEEEEEEEEETLNLATTFARIPEDYRECRPTYTVYNRIIVLADPKKLTAVLRTQLALAFSCDQFYLTLNLITYTSRGQTSVTNGLMSSGNHVYRLLHYYKTLSFAT